MDAGYMSTQAVKDLIAIKVGEIQYLRTQLDSLTGENARLRSRVESLESLLNKPA